VRGAAEEHPRMDEPFLDRLSRRPLLFDGGTGTEIYSRDVFLNISYEQLNIEKPELVESVHRDFLLAGAEAIETNTFAANGPRLDSQGLAKKVREINRAGASIAKRVAAGTAYVAGAVGPLGIRLEPWGPTSVEEAIELFAEQIQGLVEGGIDVLLMETFSDLVEIQAAVRAARKICELPVIAMMTVDDEGRTPEGVPPEWLGQKLEQTGADVVGVNCSVGPAQMLSVVETMSQVCERPIAAMPNAGVPRTIDGRMHYLTSPIYMARYARRFVDAGAKIVGGCCGVTPEHISAMREVLGGDPEPTVVVPRVVVEAPREAPHKPVRKEDKSRLSRKVCDGRFVTMVEAFPPRGCDAEAIVDEIARLAHAGIDSILVSDDPRLVSRMSPISLAWLILERSGGRSPAWDALEPILQYACRDRSLLGLQSELLGAHALGLRNLMPITGHARRPGDTVVSRPFFDVDAVGLTNVVSRLNHGLDLGNTTIGPPTRFFTAANATVGALDLDAEVARFGWKVDAGAEFAVTTPVFVRSELERFLERIEDVRVPIMLNVVPLSSLREAEHLAGEVPGVNVPPEVLDRFSADDDPEDARRKGTELARELLEEMHHLVEGVLVSGPHALGARAMEILDGFVGRQVVERREFPGRLGIKGGAEAMRYGDEAAPGASS
jgi:homocysteine S-methyltransferase